jgi:hypothetical protein
MSDELYGVCCLGIVIIGILLFYSWHLAEKKKEAERQANINRRREEWGHKICDMLIDKKIAIDMNEQMVRLSWGDPATIETKEILQSGVKTRWIYGVPRRGAKYIWFKNGIVTKIKL